MIKGEFYKEKIKEIEDGKTSIAIYNGKPEACKCSCYGCERSKGELYNAYCSDLTLIEWYSSEYIPPIEITKEQMHLLKSLPEDGYLTRDTWGNLCYKRDNGLVYHIPLFTFEPVVGEFDFVDDKSVCYIKHILENAEVEE